MAIKSQLQAIGSATLALSKFASGSESAVESLANAFFVLTPAQIISIEGFESLSEKQLDYILRISKLTKERQDEIYNHHSLIIAKKVEKEVANNMVGLG